MAGSQTAGRADERAACLPLPVADDQTAIIMTCLGLSMVTLPMVAVYVVFHRQVVSGLTEGAPRYGHASVNVAQAEWRYVKLAPM